MDDDWVSATEAGAILGVSREAARTLALRGRLPHVRRGGGKRARYRFRRADVLRRAADRPAPPADDRSIDAGEAARLLGVHRATVLDWAARGLLLATRRPAVGHDAVVRFDRAEIAAFVERSQIRPHGDGAATSDDAGG